MPNQSVWSGLNHTLPGFHLNRGGGECIRPHNPEHEPISGNRERLRREHDRKRDRSRPMARPSKTKIEPGPCKCCQGNRYENPLEHFLRSIHFLMVQAAFQQLWTVL